MKDFLKNVVASMIGFMAGIFVINNIDRVSNGFKKKLDERAESKKETESAS